MTSEVNGNVKQVIIIGPDYDDKIDPVTGELRLY